MGNSHPKEHGIFKPKKTRFLSSLCVHKRKKMKTSQTKEDTSDTKSAVVPPPRSTTDPYLLLISEGDSTPHVDVDLIDLTASDEYNRKFHTEVNKRLNLLKTPTLEEEDDEIEDSFSSARLNIEPYDNDPALNLPKIVPNIYRNFSQLTKSPALHNINLYTYSDENNNNILAANPQLKDLLIEQQLDESDEKDFESFARNEPKLVDSSLSSASTLHCQTSSPLFTSNGSIRFIDDTSTLLSASDLQNETTSAEASQEDSVPRKYSAIPWFIFYYKIKQQRMVSKRKRETSKAKPSNRLG